MPTKATVVVMTMLRQYGSSRQLLRSVLLVLAVPLLGSCVAIGLDIEFAGNQELFDRVITQQADAFPEVDPLQISDEIKQLVDSRVNRQQRESLRVERLQELLFDEKYLNIEYSEVKTQTAVEAFHSRVGNCLSVMNLYVAMARYAGVDAVFQTVKVRPEWDRRGGLLVLNQHINATGKLSVRDDYVMDFTPEVALQQLTSRVVSDTHARALYFSNLGVERMLEGEFENALVYLKNALWITPQLSIAWNNIGTAYNRLGVLELAEYSYQMSFYTDPTNATAINNLARYYIARGDNSKAVVYRRAVSRFNNANPYYHFDAGSYAFQQGELEKAAVSYRRAIRLKAVEPDFYMALSSVYEYMGNDRQSIQMKARADALLAQTDLIYQPSQQRVRIIDTTTIMRLGPGITIFPNGRTQ